MKQPPNAYILVRVIVVDDERTSLLIILMFVELLGGEAVTFSDAQGWSARIMIAGSDRSVALQHVSPQGQTGLNRALGVASVELAPADPIPQRRQ